MTAGTDASFSNPPALELSDVLFFHVYGGDERFSQRCESVGLHQYGQPNNQDIDSGPYQVWRTENTGWKVSGLFLIGRDWLRSCAYVLWDSDRVLKMGRFGTESEYIIAETGSLDEDCF